MDLPVANVEFNIVYDAFIRVSCRAKPVRAECQKSGASSNRMTVQTSGLRSLGHYSQGPFLLIHIKLPEVGTCGGELAERMEVVNEGPP